MLIFFIFVVHLGVTKFSILNIFHTLCSAVYMCSNLDRWHFVMALCDGIQKAICAEVGRVWLARLAFHIRLIHLFSSKPKFAPRVSSSKITYVIRDPIAPQNIILEASSSFSRNVPPTKITCYTIAATLVSYRMALVSNWLDYLSPCYNVAWMGMNHSSSL